MNKHRIAMMLAGCVLVAGAAGCQQGPKRVMNVAAMRGETYTENPPQAVFDASSMHFGHDASQSAPRRDAGTAAVAASGPRRGAAPWWVDRNDARLAVRPRGNLSSVTDYVVHTEDRQRSFDGDVRNHYQRTRRSVEYGTLVR